MAYKIKRGDTLSALARKWGTTVEAILAANPQVSNPNRIGAGDTLVQPGTAAAPPVPRPRPAPPTLQTLPPPPLPGQIAAQGQAFGSPGASGAANLYSPATLGAGGAAATVPSVPGLASLIGLPAPGGSVNAGTNGVPGSASLVGMQPGGNVSAGSGAAGAATLDPTARNAARDEALAFLTNQLGAMNPANVIPQPSAAMVQLEAMRDEPSAWWGGNDFESLSAPKRNETNIYDSAVKNIGGKMLANELGKAVQSLPQIDAEELQNSGAAGMQGLQDQLGGLIGEGLSGLGGLLGGVVPQASPMQTAGLAGGTAPVPGSATLSPGSIVPPALTSRPVQTVPIDPATGMPVNSTASAAQPVQGTVPEGSLNSTKYWERVAANGGKPPFEGPVDWNGIGNSISGGLESLLRTIDASNGQVGENASADPVNWAGITSDLGITPAQPVTQTASGDFGYNMLTGAYEKKVAGQPYSLGPPQWAPGGIGATTPDKDVAQLPAEQAAPVASEPVQTAAATPPVTTPSQSPSIVPPTPLPYPLKAPPVPSAPPAAAKDYIDIVVPTPETPIAPSAAPDTPPAVATEVDTTYTAPPASRASFQPGMMNRAIQAPPMVPLASGKMAPAGMTGTAQGGRYSYSVLPDGAVLNTTTNRITAPGSVYTERGPMPGIPAVPPPQTNPAYIIPGQPGFLQSAFDATPFGHIAQMVQGKPVTGGLLSLIPQKAPTGSSSKPSSGMSPTDLQNMLNQIYG